MSRYLVTVTALADVWTYVVVEAADIHEARTKAVGEVQRDGAEWMKGEPAPRLLDATRVELLARPGDESGDRTGAPDNRGIFSAAD